MLRKMTLAMTAVCLFGTMAHASTEPTVLQVKMLRYLDALETAFQVRYAPTEWKKKYLQWDLATEIQKAKKAVQSDRNLNVKAFHKIVKRFSTSMKDYHVGVLFHSTESATLPFQAIFLNKRYYLSYIDRSKLGAEVFPFNVGDEIVQFGDQPVAEAVAAIQREQGDINPDTDEDIAAFRLTGRGGMIAMNVPQGPIRIGIRPQGSDKVMYRQLIWDYTPEEIDKSRSLTTQAPLAQILDRMMVSPAALSLTEMAPNNPFSLGGRTSYVPTLGKKIWETPATNPFQAYVYQAADKRLIGYLRIPWYMAGDAEAAAFGEIVQKFQSSVDGLVLDEINNPGGSVLYLYALASMLTDQDLFTPRHRMAITQEDISQAVKTLPIFEAIKNDADAKKLIGETLAGYPVTYQTTRFFLEYFRFVIREGKAGRFVTDPYFLMGVDRINPHPTVQFTKPILLLTNHLDFSGGDFFPAILQDNKRVTILGTRTAGAGGYVSAFPIENQLGIATCSITGSLAERIDLNPIENLGIKPDIEYSITPTDLQNHFADYGKAINGAMTKLLQ
jgi:hypothetical protein